MNFKVFKWVWGLFLISLIGTIIVFPKLPPNIPIHWNINGVANNYAHKAFAFFTVFFPVIFLLLFYMIPRIDPKKASYLKHQKAYEVFTNLFTVFMIAFHWISIVASLGIKINISMVINIALGILFLIIGNYMSQIRHNYFVGIRTPWTLADETVWAKTHRIGGVVFVIGGILFIAGGLINRPYGFWMAIIYLLASCIYLFTYSYLIFHQLEKK